MDSCLLTLSIRSRRFLRFGSTSNVKDASSYVISVKHRLEPILIEGFTSKVDEVVDVEAFDTQPGVALSSCFRSVRRW